MLARYRLDGGGYLIARKTPTGTRADSFFVHAIVDADGSIDARTVVHAAHAAFWVTTDATLATDERRLSRASIGAFNGNDHPADPLAGLSRQEATSILAEWLTAGRERRAARLPEYGERALRWLSALLYLLPKAEARDVCFSTCEARERDGVELCALYEQTGLPEPGEAEKAWACHYVDMALANLEQFRRLRCDPAAATMHQLADALELTVAELTAEGLLRTLDSEDARRFVACRPRLLPEVLGLLRIAPSLCAPETAAQIATVLAATHPGEGAAVLDMLMTALACGEQQLSEALLRVYRELERDPVRRLEGVRKFEPSPQTPLIAAALISDLVDLDETTGGGWLPLLRGRWSQLGDVLAVVPSGLREAVLSDAVLSGQADTAVHLDPSYDALLADVLARHDVPSRGSARAANLAAAVSAMRTDPGSLLTSIAQATLSPVFIREHLLPALADRLDLTRLCFDVAQSLSAAAVGDISRELQLLIESLATLPSSTDDVAPSTRVGAGWSHGTAAVASEAPPTDSVSGLRDNRLAPPRPSRARASSGGGSDTALPLPAAPRERGRGIVGWLLHGRRS